MSTKKKCLTAVIIIGVVLLIIGVILIANNATPYETMSLWLSLGPNKAGYDKNGTSLYIYALANIEAVRAAYFGGIALTIIGTVSSIGSFIVMKRNKDEGNEEA